ncbi:hypothetical protein BO71DRAFT_42907 [Aspergillus ellipticus CBS 707.79]|uniref:Uncharacterized protein n=1 Tax=Aspergillus ellipticus CBS 707.79 TaxID=1448320 RepID=A0A319DKE7_9EURO|nr:hypothetical protein BO71DRAFT_42907 [Aspergillus ellipticus CBS 707.79]
MALECQAAHAEHGWAGSSSYYHPGVNCETARASLRGGQSMTPGSTARLSPVAVRPYGVIMFRTYRPASLALVRHAAAQLNHIRISPQSRSPLDPDTTHIYTRDTHGSSLGDNTAAIIARGRTARSNVNQMALHRTHIRADSPPDPRRLEVSGGLVAPVAAEQKNMHALDRAIERHSLEGSNSL